MTGAIRAAIVEEDAAERARIRECLNCVERAEGLSFGITEFSDGTAFLLNDHPKHDTVFMDMEMPGTDGMQRRT